MLLLADPRARDNGDGAGDDDQGGKGGGGGDPGGLLTGSKAGEGDPADLGDNWLESVPEKFRAYTGEGEARQLDQGASFRKVLGSYLHMEKRLGAGEAPPKTADEYKLQPYLPEGYEPDKGKEKGILTALHGLKLNNQQVQGVLSLYGESMKSALGAEKSAMENGMKALQTEVWKGEGEYERNMDAAELALSVAPPDLVQRIVGKAALKNDPDLIQLLAIYGNAIQAEDDPAGGEGDHGNGHEDIQALRSSEAYLDAKHPDHKRTVEKVSAAYAGGFGRKKK